VSSAMLPDAPGLLGPAGEPQLEVSAGGSPGTFRTAFRALIRDRRGQLGSFLVLVFVVCAIFGPDFVPYQPNATDVTLGLAGPSWQHLFGTDQFGRDIFSRVIVGSRLSLEIAVGAVAISAVFGSLLGLLTGYFGGVLDMVVMRCIDILLAFPGLVFALALAAVIGRGPESLIIAVGIAGIAGFARVVRGATLSAATSDHILAARATGCSHGTILLRHLLPPVTGAIVVMTSLSLGFAVLTASAISFLGVGVQPPAAEWGALANAGRDFLTVGWWVSLFPCLVITLFVISVNLVGEVLRDALDVRMR
jgi:ABC-type dipeptide/oligopeptide/nickel transport system permease subunit